MVRRGSYTPTVRWGAGDWCCRRKRGARSTKGTSKRTEGLEPFKQWGWRWVTMGMSFHTCRDRNSTAGNRVPASVLLPATTAFGKWPKAATPEELELFFKEFLARPCTSCEGPKEGNGVINRMLHRHILRTPFRNSLSLNLYLFVALLPFYLSCSHSNISSHLCSTALSSPKACNAALVQRTRGSDEDQSPESLRP